MKSIGLFVLMSALLLVAAKPALAAQGRRTIGPQFGPQRGGPEDEFERKIVRERAKARNQARQEDLRKDMDKLFLLATELKAAVDKTTEQMLSVEVIRKTEEVEKLAKKIREKMKADDLMPGPGEASPLGRK